MKATQKTFASSLNQAIRDARIFYFCGPDEAGCADAADKVAAQFPDAERIDLSGGELKRDTVKLADEARSVSLFGDSRIIRIRTAGDEAYDAVETLLASPVEGWPVVIVATSATDKSRIAKLLADRKDALVTVFHPPDLRSVSAAVRNMGEAAGLRLTDDLAERIARATGLDTRMARSEIEKLSLYLDASPQAPRSATEAALDAIGAVSEDDGFAPLVNVVLSGEIDRLTSELARFREQDINPVGLLLAFERRAAQLAQLAGRLGKRSDIGVFLEGERVFFRDKADLARQLKRWRGKRLERLVQRLMELHRALLGDNRQADLVLAQGLTEIARAAASAR